MLLHLRVKDLVLIEELDMALAPGFNVLTGETGAGKSLVVTAFDLLLGRRASSELVRKGAKEAEVEGVFDVADEPEVKRRLEEAGLPVDDDLLVRRVIPSKGRHRCYVNGRLASLAILGELARGLASVMSQHEHHSLLEPSSQLAMLDGFADHGDLLDEMAEAARASEEAARTLRELLEKEHDRESRIDYIRYQLGEIEEIDPGPGELEALEREISLLRHQEVLLETARRGAQELYETDGSLFERLGALSRSLEEVCRFDPALEKDARQLEEASILVEEAARSLSAYGDRLETDPAALEEKEERREALRKLTRKHGTDLEGIVELGDALRGELETLSRYEDSIASARREARRLEELAEGVASRLTSSRQKAAKRLSRAVTAQLADLAFEKAAFEVALEPRDGGPSIRGGDRVQFVVTLNPGEGAHPLRSVASGGELSRMMLALRRVLAGVGPVGTYVFDEVDAGIGGAVASAVGSKLQEVGSHHQVICITHLPQISALARAHFHVSKEEKGGRTTTRVERLDEDQRVEEVARMLGGSAVTPVIREAAKDLFSPPARGR